MTYVFITKSDKLAGLLLRWTSVEFLTADERLEVLQALANSMQEYSQAADELVQGNDIEDTVVGRELDKDAALLLSAAIKMGYEDPDADLVPDDLSALEI